MSRDKVIASKADGFLTKDDVVDINKLNKEIACSLLSEQVTLNINSIKISKQKLDDTISRLKDETDG